jgi:hypothetical protein
LLELEMEPHGSLHPDCLPPGGRTPCETCGGYDSGLSKPPLLDKASLTEHPDIFRLRDHYGLIVITERFADTLRRLGFEEYALRELPVR